MVDVSAIPDPPVGVGVYLANMLRSLPSEHDLELHLLTRKNDAARWEALAPQAQHHALVPSSRPVRLAWEQTQGPKLARTLKIDLWHGPHYTLPLRLQSPSVVTIHDTSFFDHPEWHERSKVPYFRAMMRTASTRARLIIAVSRFTAQRVSELLNPQGPVVVIPHGVDHATFQPARPHHADDLAVLRSLGVRPPYLAFVGTLEPRKNIPDLIHAFARVSHDRPELRLVLAGNAGWGAREVRAAIESSGVATKIAQLGYVPAPTLPALLRQASLVAYPSHLEGFGLPALEALACGAPLVTTTGSAMEEVVGDAAVLVPPANVDALSEAIAMVLDDPQLAADLRSKGPEVASSFTWERCALEHVESYRRALDPVAC